MAADQTSKAHWHRAGLEKSGNTCYSNAAIQFLLTAKPFISRYADDKGAILEDVRKESWNTMKYDKQGNFYCRVSFNSIMVDLVRDITDERKPVISADNFKMMVSQGHREFSNSDQQDSFQYFLHLLSKIEENIPSDHRRWMDPCNSLRLKLSEKITRGNYTDINQRCEFAISCPLVESREDATSCASLMQDSNGSSSTATVQRHNSLTSSGNARAGCEKTRHIKLIDCIDKFMMKENIIVNKQSEPVSKETKIAIPPEYLVIQPGIFDHRCQLQKTSDVHLDVPDILDIKKWISPDNWSSYDQINAAERRKTRYELKAFIAHLEGSTPYTGHYVCYVKHDKIWSEYDDSRVRDVSEPPKTNGYFYMYERTNDAQETPRGHETNSRSQQNFPQDPPPDYDEN